MIIRDLLIIHARKVIVRFVVFAHVIAAEIIIFPLRRTALGSTMQPPLGAILPLAKRRSPFLPAGMPPTAGSAYADAIEIFRVEFHRFEQILPSVPSPNCRHLCCELARQFGDKGTLANLLA